TGYAYDAAGQLTEQTEYGLSDGSKADRPEIWHIHRFKRNILGQLVEKTSRRIDGTPVPAEEGKHYSRTRFDYDPLTGNLIKARNRHSSVELVYDVLDRLVSETTVHNGQTAGVGYAYDPLGNRTRTVLPDGRSINYLYYGSGHLHQINLDGEVISDIERDKLHQEIQRTQGALTSRYDYDPMGRLKHQTATANRTLQHNGKLNTLVGGAVRRSYRYDKAGNLIQTADQRSGVLDYVYDKLGRIESAVNKQSGSREKFAFDPAHNILSDKVSDGLKDKGLSENLSDKPHTGRIKGRNIGKGNRLETYKGTEYTYDALGNMIYRQLSDGGSQFFQYDSENQLVRAEIKKKEGNTEVWEYAYDPFGRRLSKERKDKLAWTSTAPKRTHFVWDGTRLLQEYNYKGSYTYIYTDQDSYEPLAQVFDNHKDRQQYLFYFHNNQIGTPHEMTDIHGNLLWYGSYSAWGSLASEKRIYENIHQPFRLQNQYFDEETGLHYNFFRYYEAETGRFTNQDPIGLMGGDNLYFFAPNVQGWIDTLGLRARLLKSIKQLISKILSKSKCNRCKVDSKDVDELRANGIKFNPDDLLATGRTPSGKVVFLEKGNAKAGLEHIIKEHGSDFARIGVSRENIPATVMEAVTKGRIVGYQGQGTGRPIYEVMINGQKNRIAVTTGSNGFIVGANPAGRIR
ncbi:RHS repeat-associated core domain-containing protein, partial [Neisseria sp. 83E34]|uniref:RHS repeat-associated core domain-containing protein n=1 Tax=Neisseria sp. 83E34 TaxID=1692264 RepID=UPI000A4C172E